MRGCQGRGGLNKREAAPSGALAAWPGLSPVTQDPWERPPCVPSCWAPQGRPRAAGAAAAAATSIKRALALAAFLPSPSPGGQAGNREAGGGWGHRQGLCPGPAPKGCSVAAAETLLTFRRAPQGSAGQREGEGALGAHATRQGPAATQSRTRGRGCSRS